MISVTPFGALYLVLGLIAYRRSYRAVAYLYGLSYLFQMSSVFSLGKIGFMPSLVSCVLLIIKGWNLQSANLPIIRNIQILSISFIMFVVLHSMIAKFLFEGSVLVYAEHGMESAIAQGKVPFFFSTKSVIQWVYLILNMGSLISLLKHRLYLDDKFSSNLVFYSVLLGGGLGLWKFIADNFWGWFPSEFIFNNENYNTINIMQSLGGKFRFSSIFSEASVCGLFLSTCFWCSVFMEFKRKKMILTFIAFCMLLSLASTGFVAMIFGGVVYLLVKRRFRTMLGISIALMLFVGITSLLGYTGSLLQMTVYKSGTDSAMYRGIIMSAQMKTFFDTFGFGLGLGSACAAGIATTLISQLGVLGTLLFGFWLWKIWRFLKQEEIQVMMLPVLVILFGMAASVGYLSFPILWFALAIAISARPVNKWCVK